MLWVYFRALFNISPFALFKLFMIPLMLVVPASPIVARHTPTNKIGSKISQRSTKSTTAKINLPITIALVRVMRSKMWVVVLG